jgi:hypothetical protein
MRILSWPFSLIICLSFRLMIVERCPLVCAGWQEFRAGEIFNFCVQLVSGSSDRQGHSPTLKRPGKGKAWRD